VAVTESPARPGAPGCSSPPTLGAAADPARHRWLLSSALRGRAGLLLRPDREHVEDGRTSSAASGLPPFEPKERAASARKQRRGLPGH
jgi:hypothetical protein